MWGTLILTGFIAAFTLDVIVSFIMPGPTPGAADVEKRIRVLIGVLIGDFMHNLCDGIFIGAAFNACNSTVGWSVAAATIYHEIAQELGDFLVLTDREQGGLSAAKALLANFLSGLSVLLGVIIVLAQDKMDNLAVGCLLAFGGGVYLQVGTVECMPKALNAATTPKMKLVVLVCFIVGAAAIGLVLIDHGHCVEDDSHAGHDHLR